MNILFDLLYHLSILVSVSIISGFISYRRHMDFSKMLLQGILMGSAAIIGMLEPLIVAPGLIFDGRSIILSVTALFYGPLASILAGVMAIAFRISQGGTGLVMGILVIVASVTIGNIFNLRNKRKNIEATSKMLLFMGIIVHIIMVLLMFTLPAGKGSSTVKLIGLPILIAYPLVTILIGEIFLKINEHSRIVDALSESQNQLNSAIDNAPIPIMIRSEDGEVMKISRKWTEITGYTIDDIPTIHDWTTKAYGKDNEKIQKLIKDSYGSDIQKADGEYKIITAEGKVKIWNFNTANIGRTVDDRKIAMTAAMDITDSKLSDEALRVSEEKYRLLTEFASDVIWILNLAKLKFTYISPSLLNLRGFTAEEGMNESLEDVLTPESLMVVKDAISRNLAHFIANPEVSNYYINEIQQPCKNGDIIWVEVSSRYRFNSDGDIEIVGVSRNIEERKKSEQRVMYLSYNDQLTGLYNRRFYEEELKRLDTSRNLPLTIVMADVNGLKLINDSFGHVMGDELLKKVAKVLRLGCRADDIIARLGGDEFIILLPKTDAFETKQIIKRINELAVNEKVDSIDISISFGYETKNNEQEKIQDIFKKAEDTMYKKKLFESPSMRSKTIKAIINTLNEKNKREEQHSHRVSELCKRMGEAIGLSEYENEELKSVGLLHDIGKIAIDENILNKPGKLTEAEFEEIKRHPEIGYRILSTVNDMSEMAEYVLAHHERWDGKGYPKGLKGEEIPFVSRIITIADAYDAMTSDRSYRGALTKEVAIGELQKNAAIQFDPELVRVFIEKVLNLPEFL
jgi:diguanylate cyclase (GGDEF)-like protein/PAS domain S-box-containing protein